MGETRIDYLTKDWNFFPGCLHREQGVCPIPHCWARDMDKRFRGGDFTPRLIPEHLMEPLKWKKPQRVGVCFTGDLFGNWVDPEKKVELMLPSGIGSIGMSLKGWVFTTIKKCPQHTLVFLTKAPWNLWKWSPFPDNAQVGVTVCNQKMLEPALQGLAAIKARVKFLSFEPVMERIEFSPTCNLNGIDWIIIGAWSRYSAKTAPKVEWIEAIVREAARVGARVFLKNNLIHVLPVWLPTWASGDQRFHGSLRQEFPETKMMRKK